jgi:hypothetical protein
MKHLSLMIILISIFIAGCSVAPIEEASPSLYKETKENIAFEIQLNDNEFDAKSDIIITATITNVGNKAIGYYSGSSSCVSHLGINIISKDTGRLLMKKPPKEIITCTEDIGTAMLEPQQSAQEKKVFLPIETMPSLDGVAASGEYEVKILSDRQGSGSGHSNFLADRDPWFRQKNHLGRKSGRDSRQSRGSE